MTFRVGQKVQWTTALPGHLPLRVTKVDKRNLRTTMSEKLKDQLTRYTVRSVGGMTWENSPGYLLRKWEPSK